MICSHCRKRTLNKRKQAQFCSLKCRVAAHRKNRPDVTLIFPAATTLPTRENVTLQTIDFAEKKIGHVTLSKLVWERCNEVTWKVLSSDGGRAALGYVIDVGWVGDKSRWLARVGDKS